MTENERVGSVPEQVVLLIHGIRTEAPWAEMVASALAQHGLRAIPIRYGYFDVVRFLIPPFRRTVVSRILREWRDIRTSLPEAEISAIAHSFGTYTICRALEETDTRLFRLVLCGSVVPRGYRWDRVGSRISSRVLNDCGTHDIWPVLAGSLGFGFGASGTFGFGTARVRDRFHKFTHSQYFDRTFVTEFWVPYLVGGEIIGSEWEERRPAPPWWQSVLQAFPLKWLLPVLIAALALGFAPFRAWLPASILPASMDGGLILDPGFESDDPGGPHSAWRYVSWPGSHHVGIHEFTASSARRGRKSAYLAAQAPDHLYWGQRVRVRPHQRYRLSGWIETRGVAHSTGERRDLGAHLSAFGVNADGSFSFLGGEDAAFSPGVFQDSAWTQVSVDFATGDFDAVEIRAELGGYSGLTTGRAWFDDLRLDRQ